MPKDHDTTQHPPGTLVSRRGFLAAGAGAALAGAAASAGSPDDEHPQAGRQILVRGGYVLTCDPALGELPGADLLVQDGRIAAVGARLEAAAEAFVLDATGLIVMPGFVDTHRHLWQGALRHALPDGTLQQYFDRIIGQVRPRLSPEDVYVGNLLSALGALHAGITTVLDWSHAGNSPAHSDAALEALRESGIRAVHAFGAGHAGPDNAWPRDLLRLRREQVPHDDGLVTLALAAGLNPADWALAREAAVPITSHVNGTGTLLPLAERMGPDNTYIHCCNLTAEEWRLIADTGGGVSIAGPVEMQMGHGVPPFQAALDHGVPLGLGNDVETSVPGEFFGQMRMALALQRMLVHDRARRGEPNLPPLMTVRDVLAMATLGGARVNHLADRTGSLSPDKQADFIVLRDDPTGDIDATRTLERVFVGGIEIPMTDGATGPGS